jgi:hypothetical protein
MLLSTSPNVLLSGPALAAAKLGALVRRTRQAKEEAERALSAKLGRRINIMGEVNQLI